jgi:hypothetical protein
MFINDATLYKYCNLIFLAVKIYAFDRINLFIRIGQNDNIIYFFFIILRI